MAAKKPFSYTTMLSLSMKHARHEMGSIMIRNIIKSILFFLLEMHLFIPISEARKCSQLAKKFIDK